MNLNQLNQPIAVIQYPSLIQWLTDCMVRAIAAHQESALHPQCDSSSNPMALPLFRRDRTFGTFSSPLLLQVSKGEQTLKESEFYKTISPKLWITPTGWLYAKFSPNDITTWLQNLITAKPILLSFNSNSEISNINPKISSDPVLFKLQHAHARCHSLLRLGEQEKLLPPKDLAHYFETYGSSLWQAESGVLHLQSKTEQAILSALMQFPQSLSPQKVIYGCAHPQQTGYETRVLWPLSAKHIYKQVIAWNQLFSDFHRDCRLFGTVQKETPQIALARFALITIIKNVLRFLLEDILQITAPLAL